MGVGVDPRLGVTSAVDGGLLAVLPPAASNCERGGRTTAPSCDPIGPGEESGAVAGVGEGTGPWDGAGEGASDGLGGLGAGEGSGLGEGSALGDGSGVGDGEGDGLSPSLAPAWSAPARRNEQGQCHRCDEPLRQRPARPPPLLMGRPPIVVLILSQTRRSQDALSASHFPPDGLRSQPARRRLAASIVGSVAIGGTLEMTRSWAAGEENGLLGRSRLRYW